MQLDEVLKHWESRTLQSNSDLDQDDFTYQPVPFEIVGKRRVRYTRIEPLKPRKIELDEDSE